MSLGPEGASTSEKAPVEIERKFLISRDQIPSDIGGYKHERIDQGYLVIGADGSEARLRNRGNMYTMTVKSKGTLSRGEHETELTQDQFDDLWQATAGKRVQKTRYEIPHGSGVIELDIYEGALEGLVVAEMEFDTEELADTFAIPWWFGPDVTDDQRLKNQSLAVYGAPGQ